MKIYYTCECCGEAIDTIEVEEIDEARFGFDRLTAEERQDMLTFDQLTNTMHVQSLCDHCIEAMGLADDGLLAVEQGLLH